jgi:hypothetical protein
MARAGAGEMAHYVLLFDRPADIDATGYRACSRNWIAELVRLNGFQEFSAHWNALDTSPNTMVLIRLESTEAALEALANPAITDMFEDMRLHGCRNIVTHAFRSSEVAPDPIIR